VRNVFYRAMHATNASAVLAVVILPVCPSVRLSVSLSVIRVLCDKIKQCTADILMPHQRTIILVFWHQQWLVGDVSFRL